MADRTIARHKAKVSVTVDPELLRAVDDFTAEHPEFDRSKVFHEALQLWYARQQAKAIEEQFAAPESSTERQERETWRRIRAAAAGRTFGQR